MPNKRIYKINNGVDVCAYAGLYLKFPASVNDVYDYPETVFGYSIHIADFNDDRTIAEIGINYWIYTIEEARFWFKKWVRALRRYYSTNANIERIETKMIIDYSQRKYLS